MQVITSTDFAAHQDKYFDMAIDHDICVKRGQNLFQITYQPIVEEPIYFEPDEDFYRSLSMEEFKTKALEMVERVHNKYCGSGK